MTNTAPVFYDCEASCIGGLPIEIGWAFVEIAPGEIRSESPPGQAPLALGHASGVGP